MIQKGFAVLIALVILTFAHDRSWAQASQIRVMLAEGDSITKEEGSAVLRTIQEELSQLVAESAARLREMRIPWPSWWDRT